MRSKALAQNTPIRWERNRGRNGHDVPSDVSPDQSCESLNVELVQNSLGKRRRGVLQQTFTGDPYQSAAVLARFSPAQDNTKSELHFTTDDLKMMRVAGGPNAVTLGLSDAFPDVVAAITANSAQINGKLYWAYRSLANRLHVYDPATDPTLIRRTGLAGPLDPPVLANVTVSGPLYPATRRFYRVRRQVRRSDGTLQRESEASPFVDFTPSGGDTHVQIAAPPPAEGSTHWMAEASPDNLTFFTIAGPLTDPVFLDNITVSLYASYPAAPPAGTRSAFPSVKYLAASENRLLGFGVYLEPTIPEVSGRVPQRSGRVYFTPVLDSTDQDDDERIDWGKDNPGFIDVGRNKGYEDRALCGPLDGQFLVFQSLGIYLLVMTGEVALPFQRVALTTKLGAVSHKSTFIGEDETGRPCAYFLDETRGPYRYGRNGLEWIGYDVQDVWATVNLDATTLDPHGVVAHGYYDTNLRACVWFVATGTSIEPNRCLVFFVDAGRSAAEGVRGGWVQWEGDAFTAARYSSVMFADTIAARNSRRETGYVAGVFLWKLNSASASSEAFRAAVTSPVFQPDPKHLDKTAGVAYVQSSAHAGVSLRHTLTRNFGDKAGQIHDLSIAPVGPAGRTLAPVKELAVPDAYGVQVTLGDAADVNAPTWTIDDWLMTFESGDER